jgi:hypothetical protein
MSTPKNISEIFRHRRADSRDDTVPASGLEKSARVDLGLELLMRRAKHGVELTRQDIACWCGCSDAAIYLIERRARVKLRTVLQFGSCRGMHREIT